MRWLRIFRRDEGPPAEVREAMRLNPDADHYHYGGDVCGDPTSYDACQRAVQGKPHALPGPAGTSFQVGNHPSGGPLPVEAQVFLRVMGEDLDTARELLRGMPSLERAVILFWIEQIAGLVYELDETGS